MHVRSIIAALCLMAMLGAASSPGGEANRTDKKGKKEKKVKHRGMIRGRIQPAGEVAFIGALDRKGKINPKAKMDKPETPFVGKIDKSGAFEITDLPYGTYDLVLLTNDGRRFEGFHLKLSRKYEELIKVADQYEDEDEDPDAPEEDEEDMEEPEDDSQKSKDKKAHSKTPKGKKKGKNSKPDIPPELEKEIHAQIRKMRTYENKKRAIAMIGNKRRATVLVMLLRDKTTTYDHDFGAPVATLRWEVWTWTNWYGGWTKDRDPKLLHRIIIDRRELCKRTWIWDRALGGIQVKAGTATPPVVYTIPDKYTEADGLVPY